MSHRPSLVFSVRAQDLRPPATKLRSIDAGLSFFLLDRLQGLDETRSTEPFVILDKSMQRESPFKYVNYESVTIGKIPHSIKTPIISWFHSVVSVNVEIQNISLVWRVECEYYGASWPTNDEPD